MSTQGVSTQKYIDSTKVGTFSIELSHLNFRGDRDLGFFLEIFESRSGFGPDIFVK